MPSGVQNEAVTKWALAAVVACSVAVQGAADETTVRVSIDGRVSRLGLEDYIARVVAGEGEPRAAAGAQQALAITARTYALANRNRHRREGFDLCDTTHCQVVRPATAGTRSAAQATAGRVLTRQGHPVSVFYSALCGGHSELASEVWPGADDTSSHLHEDDACRDEPGWSTDVRAGDIERALRTIGHRGRLRDVRIMRRNASGRVTRIRVDGLSPAEVSGTDFRMAMTRQIGFRHFKSTAFAVRRHGSSYRFTGTGFGHGVGLCVIGAGKRAARGDAADTILKFYFPNLSITSVTSALNAGVRKAPAAPAVLARKTPARSPAGDVVIDSAMVGSPDRAEIMKYVRGARDQIARAAGVKTPAAISVEVHPTVDAFVRTTGQPWWVSAATTGTQIHLVPVAILRQRGQLESAVRREVARMLTERALAGRSVWVREGAAAYFAEPLAAADASMRGGCPRDAELLRPVSAGAHRNAVTRAEACFRRELARGRKWHDIR